MSDVPVMLFLALLAFAAGCVIGAVGRDSVVARNLARKGYAEYFTGAEGASEWRLRECEVWKKGE